MRRAALQYLLARAHRRDWHVFGCLAALFLVACFPLAALGSTGCSFLNQSAAELTVAPGERGMLTLPALPFAQGEEVLVYVSGLADARVSASGKEVCRGGEDCSGASYRLRQDRTLALHYEGWAAPDRQGHVSAMCLEHASGSPSAYGEDDETGAFAVAPPSGPRIASGLAADVDTLESSLGQIRFGLNASQLPMPSASSWDLTQKAAQLRASNARSQLQAIENELNRRVSAGGIGNREIRAVYRDLRNAQARIDAEPPGYMREALVARRDASRQLLVEMQGRFDPEIDDLRARQREVSAALRQQEERLRIGGFASSGTEPATIASTDTGRGVRINLSTDALRARDGDLAFARRRGLSEFRGMPVNLWARGRAAWIGTDEDAVQGPASHFVTGAALGLTPDLTVGAFGTSTWASLESNNFQGRTHTRLGGAGTYAHLRLFEGLLAGVASSWEQGVAQLDTAGKTGSTGLSRWSLSSSLSGTSMLGPVAVMPSVTASYYQNERDPYWNSAEELVPGTSFDDVSVQTRMRFAQRFEVDRGPVATFTPEVSVGATWADQQRERFYDSSITSLVDNRQWDFQVGAAPTLTFVNGATLSMSAGLTGLGRDLATGYNSNIRFTLPFN